MNVLVAVVSGEVVQVYMSNGTGVLDEIAHLRAADLTAERAAMLAVNLATFLEPAGGEAAAGGRVTRPSRPPARSRTEKRTAITGSTRERVLMLLRKADQPVARAALIEATGATPSAVTAALRRLRDDGLIVPAGGKRRAARWAAAAV